ncbi:hypothetical protein [Clostridium sp. CTA-5]
MNIKELEKYWNNNFIRYEKEKLNLYKFDQYTINFLIKVGLPNGKNAKGKLAYNFLDIDNIQKKLINDEEYIKIAQYRHSDAFIAVKVSTQEVFYISLADEIYAPKDIIEYCNKDIESFIIFCTILAFNYDKYSNIEDDELEGYLCARETVEKFKEMDIKTVYKESYWINTLMNYAIDYFYEIDDKFQRTLEKKQYNTYKDAIYSALLNGIEQALK